MQLLLLEKVELVILMFITFIVETAISTPWLLSSNLQPSISRDESWILRKVSCKTSPDIVIFICSALLEPLNMKPVPSEHCI